MVEIDYLSYYRIISPGLPIAFVLVVVPIVAVQQ
jgi:hypothetical protein